jgi:hypothetical protein
MQMFLFEFGLIMASIAKPGCRRRKDSFALAGVRIVAGGAFSFQSRLVDIGSVHPDGGGIVTGVAELVSFFDKPKHSDQTMRLMAGEAFFPSKRLVLGIADELLSRVTVNAISL